ncbi:uncharacterized protein N7496_010981 [Penicillium cataractarum]|uniref:Probable beta-glucosidase M n=1 Tax=Penicillium cataractarum TaxID=2100454 RepID=A0A9W9UV22_9EURO|nr:uncharacterized protein N7496_010981 [Penicillium cataractarum]KAJ5358568.1 hypothetical protein N7496_010981 [Penicillium cataractarum]
MWDKSPAFALLQLAGVALSAPSGGANSTSYITSDTVFYGLSPPVYPSPDANGTGDWAASYAKARAFGAQLSLEEKVNMTSGASSTLVNNGCSGNIQPIERLGFPGMCVTDAGQGVRNADFVNGWSTGLHAGASWNKELVRERAIHLGTEFRVKGANMMLGPVVGPMGRIATGGRVWETFSVDPYLAGKLVYSTVVGVQSVGVATSTKHFIGNEQETNRMPSTDDNGLYVQAVSSNIDDKTLHDYYLWPFMDALVAGTASVMCSYQRLNNSYSCQNSKLINGILKTELGFQGYVISDWTAQHAGVASANAGLDLAMPDEGFWMANLTQAVNNGSVAVSRLDDMVTRLMATWYYLDQNSTVPSPGIGIPTNLQSEHAVVNALTLKSKDTLLKSAIEGHVLVKNENNALPLKKPQMISVFGYDAVAPTSLDFSSTIYTTTPSYVNYTLWCAGGSGASNPPYIDAPIDALKRQAREDSTQVAWDFESQDPTVDTSSEACLVFLNAYAIEGADRVNLRDSYSDTLVTNVASKCNNTIVVIHNSGIRLVDTFIEHPNVTAVIFAHMPGQDTGGALADLLYGRSNAFGRLPYTVAKDESDYGALLFPAEPAGIYKMFPQSNYKEGSYLDYRAFDQKNITPRYEFGFGLTYTTFEYSGLKIELKKKASFAAYPPTKVIRQGGNVNLWTELVTISVTLENTGPVAGDEVPQLYLGIPNAPARQLRGFEKVTIEAGKKTRVEFSVTRRDMSVWDVVHQEWHLQSGEYRVYVGRSSRDLPLTGSFSV